MLIVTSESRWQELKVLTMRMRPAEERKEPNKLVKFPATAPQRWRFWL